MNKDYEQNHRWGQRLCGDCVWLDLAKPDKYIHGEYFCRKRRKSRRIDLNTSCEYWTTKKQYQKTATLIVSAAAPHQILCKLKFKQTRKQIVNKRYEGIPCNCNTT